MDSVNNLFVSTTFSKDNSKLSSVLEVCYDFNLSCIELGSNHAYEENIEDKISKYNFTYLVHNYFPIPEKPFVLNIASLNEDLRRMSINHAKTAINFTDKIGGQLYTIHPGFLVDPDGPNEGSDNYDFKWANNKSAGFNFDKAKSIMYSSLDEIISFANSKPVKIAIETEGSVLRREYLLMQTPDEYEDFFRKFGPNDIGINLNIGHLNLASQAFAFSKYGFIEQISKYVLAMELSHNNAQQDQHLPLRRNEWYWSVISNPRFNNVYKILEFRNTNINDIMENFKLF